MKQPYQAGDAFLEDVARARSNGKVNLWWLGQSGFLVGSGDDYLLVDPYLSDSLTEKYAATEKPHARMTERVIAPEALDFINVVTSSHNHTDHLDAATIRPLLANNPGLEVLVPRANLAFAADRLGVSPEDLTPLGVGERVTLGAFTVRAVPAAHEDLEVDERGDHKYLGYLIGVAGKTLYHSGDTVLYPGMQDFLQVPIDVAILPINGRDPARGVAGNLSAAEAVELAQTVKASLVIPCHRALRQDGGLGGYRWGVERKAALLEGEAEHPE